MTEITAAESTELIKEATRLVDSAREAIVYHRDIPRAKALLEEATAVIFEAAALRRQEQQDQIAASP